MISPPRVRHRRKEAAVLAAVLTALVVTIIAVILGVTLLLVSWFS